MTSKKILAFCSVIFIAEPLMADPDYGAAIATLFGLLGLMLVINIITLVLNIKRYRSDTPGKNKIALNVFIVLTILIWISLAVADINTSFEWAYLFLIIPVYFNLIVYILGIIKFANPKRAIPYFVLCVLLLLVTQDLITSHTWRISPREVSWVLYYLLQIAVTYIVVRKYNCDILINDENQFWKSTLKTALFIGIGYATVTLIQLLRLNFSLFGNFSNLAWSFAIGCAIGFIVTFSTRKFART
ncbi:MAG: hypothetical protein N4A46_15935 [Schleiferiaceae bacterium]|jgi:hypothetical protein|nr:hypothetical protein [Schleiferiaceae bacterium]